MGRLRATDGAWFESEGDKVDGLVKDLFVEGAARDTVIVEGGGECSYSADEVLE